jgi:hypothetical protein
MVLVEGAVHDRGSYLEHQMRPAGRPSHLLIGVHPAVQQPLKVTCVGSICLAAQKVFVLAPLAPVAKSAMDEAEALWRPLVSRQQMQAADVDFIEQDGDGPGVRLRTVTLE